MFRVNIAKLPLVKIRGQEVTVRVFEPRQNVCGIINLRKNLTTKKQIVDRLGSHDLTELGIDLQFRTINADILRANVSGHISLLRDMKLRETDARTPESLVEIVLARLGNQANVLQEFSPASALFRYGNRTPEQMRILDIICEQLSHEMKHAGREEGSDIRKRPKILAGFIGKWSAGSPLRKQEEFVEIAANYFYEKSDSNHEIFLAAARGAINKPYGYY